KKVAGLRMAVYFFISAENAVRATRFSVSQPTLLRSFGWQAMPRFHKKVKIIYFIKERRLSAIALAKADSV
ncbi:MAG: hypothetical protein KKA19_00675, partial [Candidatus Margulisbacteria bacterium]|nr:hypothetical protein [Candidatus Margulisiibacteriota bacterium]